MEDVQDEYSCEPELDVDALRYTETPNQSLSSAWADKRHVVVRLLGTYLRTISDGVAG